MQHLLPMLKLLPYLNLLLLQAALHRKPILPVMEDQLVLLRSLQAEELEDILITGHREILQGMVL